MLDQATVEDRDVFLGLFPDISGESQRYIERFGTIQYVGGTFNMSPVYPAFTTVLRRRDARRVSCSRDLIDIVASLDDAEKLKRCEQALREIAPPVIEGPMTLMTVNRKGKRPPKPAREKDRPPETLP